MPYCEQCANELKDADLFCNKCGTPTCADGDTVEVPFRQSSGAVDGAGQTPVVLDTPGITRARPLPVLNLQRHKNAKLVMIAIAMAVLVAVGGWVYAVVRTTPDVGLLIPDKTVMVGSVDANWLLMSTVSLRSNRNVAKTIERIERDTRISIDKDIAPWIGRADIAWLNDDRDRPQIAVFLEIRDFNGFQRCQDHLTSMVNGRSANAVTHAQENGHDVMSFSDGYSNRVLARATVIKDWIVIGIGDGSIEKVTDTWDGRTPNLASTARYSEFAAKLNCGTSAAWVIADAARLADVAARYGNSNGSPFLFSHSMIGARLVDSGNGLSLEGVARLNSDHDVAFFKDFATNIKPITGISIRKLPNSCSQAIILADPGLWVDYGLRLAGETMPSYNTFINSYDGRQVQRFQSLGDKFTGETALGILYENHQPGAVVAAATADTDGANQLLSAVADYSRQLGTGIMSDGNGWYWPSTGSSYEFPLSPCMRTSDQYVQAATARQWLENTTGTPGLQLPSEANGAVIAAFGNFKQLNDVMGRMRSRTNSRDLDKIDWSLVNDATWDAWLKVDPTGQTLTLHVGIDKCDWKSLLNNVAATTDSYLSNEVY